MIFGTDGIRARVGHYPLVRETIEALSATLNQWLPQPANVVMGRDTRLSSPEIQNWITAHLSSARVWDLGVVPTPVVAYETKARGADLGIMITASHNPAPDNGLKFFDGQGLKIQYQQARAWSAALEDNPPLTGSPPSVTEDSPSNYRKFILQHFKAQDFSGVRMGFDLAHGAGFETVKQLCADLEIDAVFSGDGPNGSNINDGVGALHPQALEALVGKHQLQVAFALDGDGDRLTVAAPGFIHGDHVLYALYEIYRQEQLPVPQVVGTILCGLGLERALEKQGAKLIRTPVGDQNVLAELTARGLLLGGEPSGHLIQSDLFPAGDGFLGALRLAKALKKHPDLFGETQRAVPLFPVLETSYRVRAKPPLESIDDIQQAAGHLRQTMGTSGRLILRYSGTEPKLRLFVEAPDLNPLQRGVDSLETAIERTLM